MAMVNRQDGTIRSVTYLGSGDGTVQSGATIMFALGMIIRTIDPALTDETANNLTLSLMDAITSKIDVEKTLNGVRYGASSIPEIGFLVAINPAL